MEGLFQEVGEVASGRVREEGAQPLRRPPKTKLHIIYEYERKQLRDKRTDIPSLCPS